MHRRMTNSKVAAAGVFLLGIAVIAYTTLDVQRHIQMNERPVTAEQQRAFEAMIDSKLQRKRP
jgi:hypothetical protein